MSGVTPDGRAEAAVPRPRRHAALVQRLPELVIFLVLIGLSVWDGLRIYQRPRIGAAEAGSWLIGIAVLLAGFVLLYVIQLLRAAPQKGGAGRLRPVAMGAGLLLLYAMLMPVLGYMIATALFTAAYLIVFGRYAIGRSVLAACVFAVVTANVWSMLQLTLPQGLVPWP